ncbi:MAG: hypothetical protein GC151_01095 [Betaproteobacteria bacterium]|nr:hypothetical protein [Betaproteobacteria bacterium]
MADDDYLEPEDEYGCRQTLHVSGDPQDLNQFRHDLEESERWGNELDWFLRFGDFDPVPDPLFKDSSRTMGRLCVYLRERWGDYADSSHPVLIVAQADNAITYEYFTSRTPLLGLVRMFSAEYRALRFTLDYSYPDGNGYDGHCVFENGEMTDGLEETYEYMSHSDFEEFSGFDVGAGRVMVLSQDTGGAPVEIPDLKPGPWDLSFAVETALKWGQAAVSFFVFHHEAYTCDVESYKGMDSFVVTVGFERTELGDPARPVVVGVIEERHVANAPEFHAAIKGTEHQARRILLASGGFIMELARCDRLADPYWHIDQLKLRCYRDASRKVIAIVFDTAADASARPTHTPQSRMKGGKVYMFPDSKTRH